MSRSAVNTVASARPHPGGPVRPGNRSARHRGPRRSRSTTDMRRGFRRLARRHWVSSRLVSTSTVRWWSATVRSGVAVANTAAAVIVPSKPVTMADQRQPDRTGLLGRAEQQDPTVGLQRECAPEDRLVRQPHGRDTGDTETGIGAAVTIQPGDHEAGNPGRKVEQPAVRLTHHRRRRRTSGRSASEPRMAALPIAQNVPRHPDCRPSSCPSSCDGAPCVCLVEADTCRPPRRNTRRRPETVRAVFSDRF